MNFSKPGSASLEEPMGETNPPTHLVKPEARSLKNCDSYFMIFQPELAVVLGGASEAIVVQRFLYWDSKSQHCTPDGRRWFWNGYKEWLLQFPWLKSTKNVSRIIRRLEQLGVAISKHLDQLLDEGLQLSDRDPNSPWNRHKWYTVDWDCLAQLLGDKADIVLSRLLPSRKSFKLSPLRNCSFQNNRFSSGEPIDSPNCVDSSITNNQLKTDQTGETPPPQFPQTPSPTQNLLSSDSCSETSLETKISAKSTEGATLELPQAPSEITSSPTSSRNQTCTNRRSLNGKKVPGSSLDRYVSNHQSNTARTLTLDACGLEEVYLKTIEKDCKPARILKGRLFPWQCSGLPQDFDVRFLSFVQNYLETTPNFRERVPKLDDASNWLAKAKFSVERLEQAIALWHKSQTPDDTAPSPTPAPTAITPAYTDPKYMSLETHRHYWTQLQELGEEAFAALGFEHQVYLQWKQRSPVEFKYMLGQLTTT